MSHPYMEGRDVALGLDVGDVPHAGHVYATRAGYLPGSPERRAFLAGFHDYKPCLSVGDDGRIRNVWRAEKPPREAT
jgi:hypothetical protein